MFLPHQQNISSLSAGMPEPDYHSALVLTLESSLITACYNKSLVTKGFFQTFCLRFAEDFNTSQQNWKPLTYKGLMNACKRNALQFLPPSRVRVSPIQFSAE